MELDKGMSRRKFLITGGAGALGIAGLAGISGQQPNKNALHAQSDHDPHAGHGGAGMVGQVNHAANQFDPHEILYDFDYGVVSEENGRTVRTWKMVAVDKEFEIAPGLFFPAWVYGSQTSAASIRAGHFVGQCPGPTLRCVEGEHLRIEFTNASSHPHTIHFHGIHSAFMDGIPASGEAI